MFVPRQKEIELKQLELDRQLERENKRKEKQLQKLRSKELIDMSSKIRAEQKAVALSQRRMESVRVLRALFERIEVLFWPLLHILSLSLALSNLTAPTQPLTHLTPIHNPFPRSRPRTLSPTSKRRTAPRREPTKRVRVRPSIRRRPLSAPRSATNASVALPTSSRAASAPSKWPARRAFSVPS